MSAVDTQTVKCLLREYADEPLVFDEVPQWLQEILDRLPGE